VQQHRRSPLHQGLRRAGRGRQRASWVQAWGQPWRWQGAWQVQLGAWGQPQGACRDDMTQYWRGSDQLFIKMCRDDGTACDGVRSTAIAWCKTAAVNSMACDITLGCSVLGCSSVDILHCIGSCLQQAAGVVSRLLGISSLGSAPAQQSVAAVEVGSQHCYLMWNDAVLTSLSCCAPATTGCRIMRI
jgi:hypothetical protein